MDPTKNNFNWNNVENGYISSNVSYPLSFLNTLYNILHRGFTFSLKLLISISWENWSLSFDFSKGIISSLKNQQKCYHQRSTMKLRVNRKHKNSNPPCKKYNLGAPGTDFFHIFLNVKEGFQMSLLWLIKQSIVKFWLLILEICQDPLMWHFNRFC